MAQLTGKTALVTGGTSGIGLATAQRLATEGAHVFVTGRSQSGVDHAVSTIGAQATGVRSDVTDAADLQTLAKAIADRGRGLDVVFANAGGGEFATLADETPEHLADTLNRNVGGTVFTVQSVLPLLNEGASIVLAGSTSASAGVPAFGAYAASKAAVRSLGRWPGTGLARRDGSNSADAARRSARRDCRSGVVSRIRPEQLHDRVRGVRRRRR